MANTRKRRNARTKRTRKNGHSSRTYYTLNNGIRPFKVVISGKNCKIYTLDDEYTKLAKEYKTVSKVFVGKSIPGDDMYASYPKNPSKAKKEGLGNSILLKFGQNKYCFVGHVIYEFKTKKPIKEFHSIVGRNAVPYPLALTDDNVYFFLENRFVPRKNFEEFPKKYSWEFDGYSRYWGINEFESEGDLRKVSKKF